MTEPDEHTVRFIRPQGDTFVVAYDVVFRENALPALFGPATPELNAEERAQYDARSLALENIELRCTQSYNTVALPDPDGEGWLVWALAATTEPDVMQIGGHHRFTVSADGQTVEQRDTLSRSCLAMSPSPEGMPEGTSLAFLTVSHIVSTTPVETHVFLNLQHDISPMVIAGENAIWQIEDGDISPADLN